MKVLIHVEGGRDGANLHARCRQAFKALFERLLPAGTLPRVVPCGSREDAFESFCTGLRSDREVCHLLLVDSEDPVAEDAGRWTHLHARDRWRRPNGCTECHVHLMVQSMESWFLADREALRNYFDGGFQASALPARRDVEQVLKADVIESLHRAARRTKKKGYDKGRDSFAILALLRPEMLAEASPHARIFFDTLLRKCP